MATESHSTKNTLVAAKLEQLSKIDKRQLYISSLGLMIIGFLIVDLSNRELNIVGRLGYWSIPAGLAASIITYALLFAIIKGPYKRNFQPDIRKLIGISASFNAWDIVLLSLLAGFGEELLFRVAIQDGLLSVVNETLAVVITAIIFALLHTVSIYYFLASLVIGAFFGIAYAISDSFLFVAIWHMAYDMLAIGLMRYKPDLFD